MPNDQADLAALIADAKLVLAYGARAGRLPDEKLESAIEMASAANGPETMRLTQLTAALNQALKAIAPVTLLDLGSRWRPFSVGPGWRIGRIAFVLYALVLILVTGYYTQIYTQLNAILRELTEIQSQNLREKSERFYHFFVKNRKILLQSEWKADDDLVFEPYMSSYGSLQMLSDRLQTYVPLANNLIARSNSVPLISPVLRFIEGKVGGPADPLIQSYISNKDYPQAPGGPGPTVTTPNSGSGSVTGEAQIPGSEGGIGPHTNASGGQSRPDVQTEQGANWPNMLERDQEIRDRFLYVSGINTSYASYSLGTAIYECQRTTALLGVWVLPALFGLLGATVFQMRAILNPMVPEPSPERLVLRLALGCFAGISVFWVFGPAPQGIAEGTSSGIGAFGLAFLLGFSIDIFFTTLDRLIGAVSQTLAKSGE